MVCVLGVMINKKERVGGAKQRGEYENALRWEGVLCYLDKQEESQQGEQEREKQGPSHAAQ